MRKPNEINKTRKILAIDPGTTESAFVATDGVKIDKAGKWKNEKLLMALRLGELGDDPIFIEMIASYGMPVGREVFETCVWIGRFHEACLNPPTFLYRKDVTANLNNGNPKATDATVRRALIDRFGPGDEKAIGRKKSPGPLYGITGDMWAALGLAITAIDLTGK